MRETFLILIMILVYIKLLMVIIRQFLYMFIHHLYIKVTYIEIMEYKIKHLDKLLKLGISKDKFALIQSAVTLTFLNIYQR